MTTDAEWQQRLDAIEYAIASGSLRVSYGDKSNEYRSMAELFAARDFCLVKLGRKPAARRTVATFSNGF